MQVVKLVPGKLNTFTSQDVYRAVAPLARHLLEGATAAGIPLERVFPG
jgi:hypothetical protein